MHQIRFRLGLHPRPCYGSLERGKAGRAGLERGGRDVRLRASPIPNSCIRHWFPCPFPFPALPSVFLLLCLEVVPQIQLRDLRSDVPLNREGERSTTIAVTRSQGFKYIKICMSIKLNNHSLTVHSSTRDKN